MCPAPDYLERKLHSQYLKARDGLSQRRQSLPTRFQGAYEAAEKVLSHLLAPIESRRREAEYQDHSRKSSGRHKQLNRKKNKHLKGGSLRKPHIFLKVRGILILFFEPWLESQNTFAGDSTLWRPGHCTNASSHPGRVPVLMHPGATDKSGISSPPVGPMPWYIGPRQVPSHLEKDRCRHVSKEDNGCVPRQTTASKAMQLDARLGRFPRAM